MATEHFDITIVGGGMVGATLAIALSHSNYRVALIEAHLPDADNAASFDDRAIALSWGSSRLLQQLQLWSALANIAAPIEEIHVSDKGHFGISRIRAIEESVPALGYVVTARELGAVLTPQLTLPRDRLKIFCPARLETLQKAQSSVVVQLQQEQQQLSIATKLLVAADGAQSTVRQLLGVAAEEKAYQQHAVIANITTEKPHNGVAYERFTKSGPIAVLPMQRHKNTERCSLVWTVPETASDELLNASDETFLQQLQQQFGYRLGYLQTVGGRFSYALSLVRSEQHFTDRIVFVGNAAQTLHPVAGQGFNLALRDVSTLLDCLLHPQMQADPGAEELLQSFQQRRRRDQQKVIRFTDSLIGLFSNNYPLLRHARAAGLQFLDSFPVLRRQLARQAMGLNMPLPHLGSPISPSMLPTGKNDAGS